MKDQGIGGVREWESGRVGDGVVRKEGGRCGWSGRREGRGGVLDVLSSGVGGLVGQGG